MINTVMKLLVIEWLAVCCSAVVRTTNCTTKLMGVITNTIVMSSLRVLKVLDLELELEWQEVV